MPRSNMDYVDGTNLGAAFVLSPKPQGTTLTRWLYDELRRAILAGKLKRGWALPPTREFADRAGVSRHIVVNVYAQLRAEGYVHGAVGRGTFVRQDVPDDFDSPAARPPSLGVSAEPRPEGYEYPSRPFCLTRPSLDEFPLAVWKRVASRAVKRLSPSCLQGGQWAGPRRLRTIIASYLAASRGVSTTPDNIVVVSGAQ